MKWKNLVTSWIKGELEELQCYEKDKFENLHLTHIEVNRLNNYFKHSFKLCMTEIVAHIVIQYVA